MLSRYARSLSAGWSSMQSEHNAPYPGGKVRMTPALGARAEKTLRSVLRFHPIVTAHAHDNTENRAFRSLVDRHSDIAGLISANQRETPVGGGNRREYQ